MNGIIYAIASALFFGLSTPFAKLLTEQVGPVALAGLLYLGAGIGLLLFRILARGEGAPLHWRDLPWFGGAVLSGGIVAPILLMAGLARLSGSNAALLLNLESVFTALLAWLVFREHFNRRIVLGMGFIVAGGIALTWSGAAQAAGLSGALYVTGACLLWALDNNLTRHVSGADPLQIAGWKGLAAGGTNTLIAFLLNDTFPAPVGWLGAMGVGFVGYGVSLVLFVLALRDLGASRTGAYFALAPFVGAAASFLLLHETPGAGFATGLALMAMGVWLHLTERHAHEHYHEAMVHSHSHVHDEHHKHAHDFPVTDTPHTHLHEHAPMVHSHPHFPDIHHRHTH